MSRSCVYGQNGWVRGLVMSTCLSNLVRVIPIDEGMMRRIRGGGRGKGTDKIQHCQWRCAVSLVRLVGTCKKSRVRGRINHQSALELALPNPAFDHHACLRSGIPFDFKKRFLPPCVSRIPTGRRVWLAGADAMGLG